MRKNFNTLFACVLLMVAVGARAQSNFIKTVAGNGTTAPIGGENIAATTSTLWSPESVAVDIAGNIYIAEKSYNRIRKITKTTGKIATIAGNGTAGYSGDGHAAASAELSGPTGVAVDATGNVYVADYANNCIRKITTAGIISTIAGQGPATTGFSGDGGPASAASFNGPAGVAVDAAGNIYIADQNNSIVRVIAPSTGNINAFAGSGTYGFSPNGPATDVTLAIPVAVCVDTAGNVYIADQGTSRILKVSGGMETTVAGTGTSGYMGDGGVAVGAELNSPYGVAVDRHGNIFIGDAGNQVIREVTAATGNISTFASSDTAHAGFRGDGGLATNAELNTPQGVAVDTAGNLYIADEGNNRVREVYSKNTVGVQQLPSQISNITVYPDPNNGTFTIKGSLNNFLDQNVSFSVTDMLGQVVYENSITVHNGMLNTQVSLQNSLPQGLYMLNIRSETQNQLAKFVIQR